jgi:hypothetical protein
MPTKKETTSSSATKTSAKKAAEPKKAATERKPAGASAARQPKAAVKDDAAQKAAAPAAEKMAAAPETPAAAPRKIVAEKPAVTVTRILAYVDIGHGNTLFLRGEGAGLSWDAGIPMECVGGDCWSWSVGSAGQPITFKVLINDQQWAGGDNLSVAPGDTATFRPAF